MIEWLITKDDIDLINQYETGISAEENTRRRREGLLSDLYITGCNAITENGELVNVDGDGNRVAEQIFGPHKVLMIASVDKIVPDIESGFERIQNIAAPKNIERLNAKAINMGKEPKYTRENISNKYIYIDSDIEGRTTIILVKEKLDF